MKDIISIDSGFQYSVNISYDLNDNKKLNNFIPTKAALNFLEEILASTNNSSNERARILIGAYGKGKSHIVLMVLSILMKKDLRLLKKVLPKLEKDEKLSQLISNYYESDNRLFPVVISGNSNSLSQAFLYALQKSLKENELLDIMPETNYEAAIQVINKWKSEYIETYEKLKNLLDIPMTKFIDQLESYDIEAYEIFEKLYPKLTAGSLFNPFLGFDVVELYEKAAIGLRKKGYSGIYVIYDEFSKFLEGNITDVSGNDIKLLQDFAEKCNRSGKNQLHLMLISHKEIANYIDKLPKRKIDGWRGVSERFLHMHLNNNFSQTYEIIASVLQKNEDEWNKFIKNNSERFNSLLFRYRDHSIFSDIDQSEVGNVIINCYPLHPITTFILPRLSEKIAQNERTLFTFLSSKGPLTLTSFLEKNRKEEFKVVTPDIVYDYFETLLKKEIYTKNLYDMYKLTEKILLNLNEKSLESKIVKTISLIYILEQFDVIKPTKDEIIGIYSIEYTIEEIEKAIENLIEYEYVIYLRKSNNFLKLKETSGIDIKREINDTCEKIKNKLSIKEIFNKLNHNRYIYPARYNDEKEMTRYFSFEFINESEIKEDINWEIKRECINADGVIYAILPEKEDSIIYLRDKIIESSEKCDDCIFILPKKYKNIRETVLEYSAVEILREKAIEDKVLFDEYTVIFEDLKEVIMDYINAFVRPEEYKAYYFYKGTEKSIMRKAMLTNLLSDICDKLYYNTPIVNNEAINKNEITSIANNSRKKIVAALLRNDLESNLGLTGSGQEVSIMRSLLIRTGILVECDNKVSIELDVDDRYLSNMFCVIKNFIEDAKKNGRKNFGELYKLLISKEGHIGLRLGIIPIYLSVIIHIYKKELIIFDDSNQMLINLDTIMLINADPNRYSFEFLDWDTNKEEYISSLEEVFSEYVNSFEKNENIYDYIVFAMKKWYLSLPKYTKEVKVNFDGSRIDNKYIKYLKLLKQNLSSYEFLFKKLPELLDCKEDDYATIIKELVDIKFYFDNRINNLIEYLNGKIKEIFIADKNLINNISLNSVVIDWCETLNPNIFEKIFSNGTDKYLKIFNEVVQRKLKNEYELIEKIGKLATGLRIEDWNDQKIELFFEEISNIKKTAENFMDDSFIVDDFISSEYQIGYVDENGDSIIKRFDSVEKSKRGKLLFNSITANIEAMGQSISDDEKRQILMEIIKELL